jgi:hypothetical protein
MIRQQMQNYEYQGGSDSRYRRLTDGTRLPTSFQGEGAAVDAAAVAAETAVVATSRRHLSTDIRTNCPRFFFFSSIFLFCRVYIS